MNLTPISTESFRATWMLTIESLEGDDPRDAWIDLRADARTRRVEFGDEVYTPDEARELATALVQAADHAEKFPGNASRFLHELISDFPEIGGLPSEQQCTIRDALRAAANRYRSEGEQATKS